MIPLYPTYDDFLRVALEQSALESSCAPEDFLSAESRVTLSARRLGERAYLETPVFCDLTSYGPCVVATADERFMPAARAYMQGLPPYRCFETPRILELQQAGQPFGMSLYFMAEYYLPDPERVPEISCPYALRVLEPGEFDDLYAPRWHNALSETRRALDRLAVGAYMGDRLIGLAGCSADCDAMWQVGVDVLPEYRRQGVASAVTARLTREIIRRGKTPFYGAAWANLASARNALRCGYKPAWVQLSLAPNEQAAKRLLRESVTA